jgi:hypothetical protein
VNRTTLAVIGFASLAFCGCKKLRSDDLFKPSSSKGVSAAEKKPIEPTPPGAKIEWHELDFTITGTSIKGSVLASGVKYRFSISGLPEGTQVKVGDKEESATAYYTHDLDFGAAIGQTPPADALDYQKKIDPKASVQITFPDKVKISSALPPVAVKFGLEEALKNLKNGTPVLFGNEPDTNPAAHTILWPYANTIDDEGLFGPAKTMRDVDWIASEEELPLRTGGKKCSGYKASDEAGPGKTLDLSLQDWNVHIIERKTGKVIDTKKFEADGTCPLSAFGDVATSTPGWDAVKAWIRTIRNHA